ncbi:MAG TPA: glutaredoxin family protein [Solirubrobacteraceae bacterium]|nr:glutaredoxin family protein [Solirubrobacteraceae bacterium]
MSRPGPSVVVTLYGKDDCHLCEDARAVLERVRGDHPFELVERDITTDDSLHRAYLERIPVVVIDGEEAFELFVDEAELRGRLARVDRP